MSGVAVHLPGERGHAVTTRAAPIKPSQRRVRYPFFFNVLILIYAHISGLIVYEDVV